MLFNLEYDAGNVIEGYIIPDGFSDKPSIKVSDAAGEIFVLPCDQIRPAVVASGRHESGLVGFRLDESNLPDIASRTTLSVHDAKSGLLIYRRPQVEQPVQMKIIRLETQLLPNAKFDFLCGRHFQYQLSSVERYGHETTLQAFHLNAINSIYLSGRLLMRNYEEFFDKGFQAITLLPDPFYELALRLFLLKRLPTTPVSFIGERDRILLSAAVEYFSEVNLSDEVQLKVALKKAPQKVTNVIASPTVRQLSSTFPEQAITRSEVAPAIDLLSRFAIVGHSGDIHHFQQAVSEMFNISIDDLPVPQRHSQLEELATRLRSMYIAESLLEYDLIFDHYVRQAISTVTRTVEA